MFGGRHFSRLTGRSDGNLIKGGWQLIARVTARPVTRDLH